MDSSANVSALPMEAHREHRPDVSSSPQPPTGLSMLESTQFYPSAIPAGLPVTDKILTLNYSADDRRLDLDSHIADGPFHLSDFGTRIDDSTDQTRALTDQRMPLVKEQGKRPQRQAPLAPDFAALIQSTLRHSIFARSLLTLSLPSRSDSPSPSSPLPAVSHPPKLHALFDSSCSAAASRNHEPVATTSRPCASPNQFTESISLTSHPAH